VVEVIDRLLVVLVLVEISQTVRFSIRSHTLVTEPFLVVGLIATIRRVLVVTLDAANLAPTYMYPLSPPKYDHLGGLKLQPQTILHYSQIQQPTIRSHNLSLFTCGFTHR
jgi:hypothetical protein